MFLSSRGFLLVVLPLTILMGIDSGEGLAAGGKGKKKGEKATVQPIPAAHNHPKSVPAAPTGPPSLSLVSIGSGRPMADLGSNRPFSQIGSNRFPTPPGLVLPTGGGFSGVGEMPGAAAPPVLMTVFPDPSDLVIEQGDDLDSSLSLDEAEQDIGVSGELVAIPHDEPVDSLSATDSDSRFNQAVRSLAADRAQFMNLLDRIVADARYQLQNGYDLMAESSYCSATTLLPEDGILHVEYSLAHAALGNIHGAVREIGMGFRLNPELVGEQLNIMALVGGEDEYLRRFEIVDMFVVNEPLSNEARFFRGYLSYCNGDLGQAKTDFDRIYDNDAEFPYVRAFRSRLDRLTLLVPPENSEFAPELVGSAERP